MKQVISLCCALGLSACSLFNRSSDSGYYPRSEVSGAQEFYRDKQAYEEEQSLRELGYSPNQELTDIEQQRLENRMVLRRLETRLETDRERRQYYSLKGLMKSDGERVTFLRIPTVEARERWASNRGIRARENDRSETITHLIEKNDITLGMSHKAVLESWGDPDGVEVSGNTALGNERWKYSRYISGNEGYNKQLRMIYFEAGRVVGWETY